MLEGFTFTRFDGFALVSKKHKTLRVNVSVGNIRVVEQSLTECPIDTRPTYSHFLLNRRPTHSALFVPGNPS